MNPLSSGGEVSDKVAVNADKASLPGPPLTACCAAGFLTGHAPVPGLGTPAIPSPWPLVPRVSDPEGTFVVSLQPSEDKAGLPEHGKT